MQFLGKPWKMWENRYQVCNNRNRNKLFGVRTKLSYNKMFSLAIEMKRIWILRNKPVSLGLSILEYKIPVYEFWYD